MQTARPSGEPPTKQTLLSDYGISSSPKTSRVETLGNKHGPLVEVKLEPGVPPKVGKVEEGRRASDEGGKRKLAGCRCGNATLCPGKLTCCGQRCPCYVDNLACTDCKCKGCRNPHRWLAKLLRSSIKLHFQARWWQGATYPALQ